LSQKLLAASALLVVSAIVGSCSQKDTAAPAGPVPAASPAAGAPAAPVAGAAPPAEGRVETVAGPVVETMNASNYTYVRVKTGSGDVWAASAQFPVAVGDRVVVPLETPMSNFHSASLNRDFPMIYFASQITREGEGQVTPPPMALGHGPAAAVQAGAGAAAAGGPIAPPAGGVSVAKVWADRKSLAGKTVTVRGRVVKFNGGILDRNWIHIQDGSGSAADGTNDLLVTSTQAAKVGDVVTATGTVAVDQDFTAGYAYKVLLEKATLK
jgi:hypothetical protein